MQINSMFTGDHKLPVMMLPLVTDNMLVPDIMVVEVCQQLPVQTVEDSPEWFAGYIQWRNYKIPLISFETLNGAMALDVSRIDKIAVIKSTAEHGYLPYYAVAISASPSIHEIVGESVLPEEGRPRGRAELLSVALEGKTAGIPNTEWIESHLLTYILHS